VFHHGAEAGQQYVVIVVIAVVVAVAGSIQNGTERESQERVSHQIQPNWNAEKYGVLKGQGDRVCVCTSTTSSVARLRELQFQNDLREGKEFQMVRAETGGTTGWLSNSELKSSLLPNSVCI